MASGMQPALIMPCVPVGEHLTRRFGKCDQAPVLQPVAASDCIRRILLLYDVV